MNPFDTQPSESQDTTYEVTPRTEHSTACDHEWGYTESDPNSDLVSLACSKCWQGASVNPTLFEVKDGKIQEKAA